MTGWTRFGPPLEDGYTPVRYGTISRSSEQGLRVRQGMCQGAATSPSIQAKFYSFGKLFLWMVPGSPFPIAFQIRSARVPSFLQTLWHANCFVERCHPMEIKSGQPWRWPSPSINRICEAGPGWSSLWPARP